MTKIDVSRHFDIIAVDMVRQPIETDRACPVASAFSTLRISTRVPSSRRLSAFSRALDTVLDCQMNAQEALELREHYDVPSHRQAWQVYLDLLSKVHDTILVFELVATARFASETLKRFQKMALTEAVDRLFTATITSGSTEARALVH